METARGDVFSARFEADPAKAGSAKVNDGHGSDRPVVDESESEVEIVQALNTRLRLQDTAGEPSS
jgi:hypothetical protein